MYTDAQYRRQCIRERCQDPSFPGLAPDAQVGRVEDWPDQSNAGAFVIDRRGGCHFILNREIELKHAVRVL